MNKVQRWIYAGLLVIALVGLAVVVLSDDSAAAGKQAKQEATPVPAGQEIEQLQSALQSDQLSESARRSLQEKLGMAERMAAEQVAGAQAPRREKVAPPLPAAALEYQASPVLEGIFEGSQGLIRPSIANILNVWQGERNGALLQVFAGSLPEDSAQGIVLVVQILPEEMKRKADLVQAPGLPGALRINEAREGLLILSAEDGSLFTFDLNTLAFQD